MCFCNCRRGRTMTTHPMHLFDPALKGFAGKPARPVRVSPTRPNDVFLNALLATGTTTTLRRSPLQWVAATGLHIVILATLIIVPLYTTETIQLRNYEDTSLVTPPAAPPPPPPASGRPVAPHVASKRPNLTYSAGIGRRRGTRPWRSARGTTRRFIRGSFWWHRDLRTDPTTAAARSKAHCS